MQAALPARCCSLTIGSESTTADSLLLGLPTAVDLGRDEQDVGQSGRNLRKVTLALGGAAAYRRSMLEDIGFLDPDFFMTFEDLDISFRGQLQWGYECVFIPARDCLSPPWHATRKKNPAQDVFFSQRNIELAYLKNMPLGMILNSLPHRLVYEFGGAAYFTKLGVGTAFFKAKMDAIRRLPSLLRKRKELQKRRTLTNQQLRSMLLHYRLRPKWKKFSSAWTKEGNLAVTWTRLSCLRFRGSEVRSWAYVEHISQVLKRLLPEWLRCPLRYFGLWSGYWLWLKRTKTDQQRLNGVRFLSPSTASLQGSRFIGSRQLLRCGANLR